jgi:DeoR family glycerol-3-phosphate regulon repressor
MVVRNLNPRQAMIAEMLCHHDYFNVDELSSKFGVTSQTIRRDLQVLTEKGIARRRHGGVERLVLTQNQTYISRQVINSSAKHRIAAELARHIPDDVSLAFSIGTTPEVAAQALLQHKNLRVVTNNLNIAMLMTTNPTFEITIAGGRVRNDDRDIIDSSAEKLFASYRVDYGIFGVAGVDEDGSLLDFHEQEVITRQTIQKNCRQSFLVLDHSKFSRLAHVRGGFIGNVSKVFCEQKPPLQIMQILEESPTELVICP